MKFLKNINFKSLLLSFIVMKTGKFIDLFKKLKRGPQVILLKDAAVIAAFAGLGNGDKIVDAGTGSGWLAGFLAHTVSPDGKVITYERRKEFAKIAKKNFEILGLTNIKIKNKDIYEGISEKNIDAITLDLAEPEKIIPYAEKSLKKGGFLISYSPTITQVAQFVNALQETSFKLWKVLELLERDWKVEGRIVRPESRIIGHTGFITFARKSL
jgi:tRNA (adenine57-N1/adenine58-N1)-methyltransferase